MGSFGGESTFRREPDVSEVRAKLEGLFRAVDGNVALDDGQPLRGELGTGGSRETLDDPLEGEARAFDALGALEVGVGGEVDPADDVAIALAGRGDEGFEFLMGEIGATEFVHVEAGQLLAGLVVAWVFDEAQGEFLGMFLRGALRTEHRSAVIGDEADLHGVLDDGEAFAIAEGVALEPGLGREVGELLQGDSGDLGAGVLVADALEGVAGPLGIGELLELDGGLLEEDGGDGGGVGLGQELLKGEDAELGLAEVDGEDVGLEQPALGIVGEAEEFVFDGFEGLVELALLAKGNGLGVGGLGDGCFRAAIDEAGDGTGEESEDVFVPKDEHAKEASHVDDHGVELGEGTQHAGGEPHGEVCSPPERQEVAAGEKGAEPRRHGFRAGIAEPPRGPDQRGDHPTAANDEQFQVEHDRFRSSTEQSTAPWRGKAPRSFRVKVTFLEPLVDSLGLLGKKRTREEWVGGRTRP